MYNLCIYMCTYRNCTNVLVSQLHILSGIMNKVQLHLDLQYRHSFITARTKPRKPHYVCCAQAGEEGRILYTQQLKCRVSLTGMFGKFYIVPTEDKGIQFFNFMCHKDLSPTKSVQCYYHHCKQLSVKQNVKGKHSFQLMEFNLKKQQHNKTA